MKTRPKKSQPANARAGKKRATPSAHLPKVSPRALKMRLSNQRTKTTDIRNLARRWFDELWNKRNPDVLQELMHPTAVGDTEGGTVRGPAEFCQKLHTPLLGAFPDLHLDVEGLIVEGDDAVVRWRAHATHDGDSLGLPASKRRVSISGMTWLRFQNGKVVTGWDRWNANGLFAYLRDGTECATVRLPA